jgi:HEAT repeat protein
MGDEVHVMKTCFLIALVLFTAGCSKAVDKAYTVPGLLEMLKDRNPDMRYSAVSHLGKYGSKAKEAVPAIIDALKDPEANVRIGAAYALANIGPDAEAAIPALKNALKDKDRKVREGAAYALKKIEGKK